MDKIDLNISNGSCWSNVNVALEEEYIPCGNVASGNSYACCHYGDNCLSSNACFHKKFGITYLAGCTSQDFSGPACQNKGEFFNQSWVGLVRCDPDQSYWAGCPEDEGIVGSSPPTQNCQCSKDNILFEDSPRLDNIASLPLGLGGTISWFPNHEPTTAVPTNIPSTTFTRTTYSTTASSVSSKAPDESSPPTPTPSTPSTAVPSPASKLSAGDKAGIGVGSVLGALAIGCIIAMFVVMRKRKSKINESPGPRRSSPTIEPGPVQPEPPGHSSPVLGGFKAELPADEPRSPSTSALSSIPTSPTPTQSPSPGQYQPYRPGIYGNNRCSTVSELSSGVQWGPGSPAGAVSPQIPEGDYNGATGRDRSKPDTIHELQG